MSTESCVKEESEYVVTEHGQYHVVVKKEFMEESSAANVEGCWDWDSGGALAGLYWDHVVKEELVLGPEHPHRPDDALVVCDWALGDADGCPQAPGARGGAQLALRDCSVRLERLPHLEATHTELQTAPQEDTLATLSENESVIKREPHINYEPCMMCGKKFAVKSALLKHIMIHIHMPQECDMEENRNSEVGRHQPHTCDICSETFISKSDLMKHAISHIHVKIEREEDEDDALDFDFPSQDCKFFKTTVANLKRDMKPTENTYICDYCGRTFKQKLSLMCHIKVHLENPQKPNNVTRGSHTSKKHSCKQCGRKFKQLSSLKTHKSIHAVEKTYACEFCGKKFARSDTLGQHRAIHMSQKPYTCEICKMAFAQRSSLWRHGSIHEVKGKKTYPCKICNKECSDSSTLSTHKRIHTGEKPFSCEICKKRFSQSGDLKAHKRIHTGEKPYACEKCNKCFRKQTDLSRHTNTIHTRHKAHRCDVCGETFFRLYRLTEHRRIHTGEKPLKCEICLKSFSYYDDWRAHLKVHMNKKKSK